MFTDFYRFLPDFTGKENYTAPFDESWLENAEFDSEAIEAPALGAEDNKSGNRFLVVHIFFVS